MPDVVALGAHILDVLGRPVEAIPEGQGGALIEEIRLSPAGAAGGTGGAPGKPGRSGPSAGPGGAQHAGRGRRRRGRGASGGPGALRSGLLGVEAPRGGADLVHDPADTPERRPAGA